MKFNLFFLFEIFILPNLGNSQDTLKYPDLTYPSLYGDKIKINEIFESNKLTIVVHGFGIRPRGLISILKKMNPDLPEGVSYLGINWLRGTQETDVLKKMEKEKIESMSIVLDHLILYDRIIKEKT